MVGTINFNSSHSLFNTQQPHLIIINLIDNGWFRIAVDFKRPWYVLIFFFNFNLLNNINVMALLHVCDEEADPCCLLLVVVVGLDDEVNDIRSHNVPSSDS